MRQSYVYIYIYIYIYIYVYTGSIAGIERYIDMRSISAIANVLHIMCDLFEHGNDECTTEFVSFLYKRMYMKQMVYYGMVCIEGICVIMHICKMMLCDLSICV